MVLDRLRAGALALGLLAMLWGMTGCQLLSAGRGLPPQWEPDVETSSP